MILPGLIDPHVHLREPGATHKEDWLSGTKAALAGGITMLLAMPNTDPPIIDESSFAFSEAAARNKSHIDYGIFVGASHVNVDTASQLAARSAGLKMYLDQTYGPLKLDNMILWQQHIKNWPSEYPIAVHAERSNLAAILLMSILYDKPIHICHVALKQEILIIRAAKEKGTKVTCEVTPHHLFLTKDDIPINNPGKGEVRPDLATSEDQAALWNNLDVIDCFASDHAPHTTAEKIADKPPPGFPGLETSLFLYLTAVSEGRLKIDELIDRMEKNPRKIFNLPKQADTWIEIDTEITREINAEESYSRCGWTPFEGWKVNGQLRRIILRGEVAYEGEKITISPGYGQNIRRKSMGERTF